MVIIVEGCDCAGKTTLLENYDKSKFRRCVVVKESQCPDEEKVNRMTVLLDRVVSHTLYIYDRATIVDDFIYEPILNKRQSCLAPYYNLIKRILELCTLVYVDARTNVICGRLNKRGDTYIKSSDVAKIKRKYEWFFVNAKCYDYYIDTTKMSEEMSAKYFEKIVEEVRKKNERF